MKIPKHLNEFTYIDIIRTMKFNVVINAKSVADHMRYELCRTDGFPVNLSFEFIKILHEHQFPEKVKELLLNEVKEEFVSDEYYNCYIPTRYELFADEIVDQLMKYIQTHLHQIPNYKYKTRGTNKYPIFATLEKNIFESFELQLGSRKLDEFMLIWVMKPICRRCGKLLIETDNAFIAKSYIEPTLRLLQQKGKIFEFVKNTGKYVCADCFNKALVKTPNLIKISYKLKEMRMDHFASIVNRLKEIDITLTEENISIQDMDTVIEKFEEEIATLLRGLKRIYFDNGYVTRYPKDANKISGEWSSIKKRFYRKMEDKDIIDNTVSTLIIAE